MLVMISRRPHWLWPRLNGRNATSRLAAVPTKIKAMNCPREMSGANTR
jgi:hypothetical protein